MTRTTPESVGAWLAALPDERRAALQVICATIRENLHPDFEEGIQYGMIGYYLPHRVYPAGYHANPKEPLPLASVGSQKNHIGLYLFCIYTSAELLEWFSAAWKQTGRKLDMGKSCVRVKGLDAVPLEVLGELFARITPADFVTTYEGARASASTRNRPGRRKG